MFDISRKFSVEVAGRGKVSLGPLEHVASGGDGHVYRKGTGAASFAVKMFDDPDAAARGRMTEKVALLAALRDPRVVAPEALAHDARGKAVGYAMAWVEGWAMPLAFTNDWRTAEGFGDDAALAFAARMRETVLSVHSRGIVLGDANELNVIGTGRGNAAEPRYIDTDSWVPRGFLGDKIMPTILDPHSQPFSMEADWFAWAVTTFQLLTGIHPYRGTHPRYGRNEMAARMAADASVFDMGVRLNASVRDFSLIPPLLRGWYESVFRHGARTEPPVPGSAPGRQTAARRVDTAVTGSLTLVDLYTLASNFSRMATAGLMLLDDGSLVEAATGALFAAAPAGASFSAMGDGGVWAARVRQGGIECTTLHHVPSRPDSMAPASIAAGAAWAADGRLFAVVDDGLMELQRRELGGRDTVLAGRKWPLNPRSTSFGDNIAVYDALGARFLVVPFGEDSVSILRARELDGHRTLAMIRVGRIAVLSLMDSRGDYRRATAVFSPGYDSCSITVEHADDGTIGSAITASGIVVRMDANRLELASPVNGARREVDAPGLAGATLLCTPSGVLAVVGRRVLKVAVT